MTHGKNRAMGIDKWRHHHRFSEVDRGNERRTVIVVALTAVTMVVEILAGIYYGSMALLADGWHMGTHVAALSISVFAYRYARKHADDRRYTFGTGKVGALGAFASAAVLAVVALLMGAESLERFLKPQSIQFNQAIAVAAIGLFVNLLSAFILTGRHRHHHAVDATPHHHDHNLKAAYLHVLADAMTSVLAIIALFIGKYYGHTWLDPGMGMVGGLLIAHWSFKLLRDTAYVLLDRVGDPHLLSAIKESLETGSGCRVTDLHVWRVDTNSYAAIISVVDRDPKPPDAYKKRLAAHKDLAHITVEVYRHDESGI